MSTKLRGLPDWLVIARRELMERVRTKWYIAVTLLGPILMVGLIVVPAILAARAADESVRVVIVDQPEPSGVSQSLKVLLAEKGWKAEIVPAATPEGELRRRIQKDEIDGFLTLPADLDHADEVVYQGDNATNQMVIGELRARLGTAVLTSRFGKLGYTQDELQKMLRVPQLGTRHTTGEATKESGAAVFIVGYAAMFVIYLSIVLFGVNVMRSVVQEKTNRVVEIMVAAAKPRALMLGKILGVGVAGLIQVTVWLLMAALTLRFRAELLGVFGVKAGGWNVPPLGADAIGVVLACFALGYFFYASLYAAIGAMVSSDQEAQQAQTPVIMLLIIPMMCMQYIANDPRGEAAQILTIIPFSAPILMPMRYLLGGATGVDVLVTLGILAVCTWGAAWLAARIYRVGILLYGKRPSLRELGRWIKYG
jgi:ABC-2 type transport system permease protein